MAVTGARGSAGPGRRPVALVLRALGLGDLLTGVPALRALRRGLPEHEIVLAAPAPLAALLPLVGAVDRLHVLPDLRPVHHLGPRPDVAVDLHGNGPRSLGILKALRPRRLIAFGQRDHPDPVGPACPAWPEPPAWRDDEHEVHRWCRLVAGYGFDPDPADLGLPPPGRPSPVPGAVVLHPGAKHGGRRWPAARFVAVAMLLSDEGHRVVITGSRAERHLAEYIARGADLPPGDVLAGRTDLAELAAIVAGARLVVSNDTGTAHLATAYRTPSVVIFGPMAPSLWGPPPDRPWHVALWAGERSSPFAAEPGPGLLKITTGEVIAAIRTAWKAGDEARAQVPAAAGGGETA